MSAPGPAPDLVCVGSVLWDVIGRAPAPMSTNRGIADTAGRISRLPGGVALNIAMTARQMGLRPALLSHVGEDAEGAALIAACARAGLETGFITRSPRPTDRYMAIEDPDGLVAAIADAAGLEAAGEAILAPLEDGRLGSPAAPWAGLMALDGNLTEALLARLAGHRALARADLRLAPASPGKARRLGAIMAHPGATLYVNRHEAGLITGTAPSDAAEGAEALLAAGARRAVVTDGPGPAADAGPQGILLARPPKVAPQRVTGAGDTFMAAHLVAEHRGADRRAALEAALAEAARHISRPAPDHGPNHAAPEEPR